MKKKRNLFLMMVIISSLIAISASSDDDGDEDEEHGRWSTKVLSFVGRKNVLVPAQMNAKFKTECTSCHMAYLPGLLPERSWTKLMNGLDDHFGEDASLDDKTKKEIQDFLIANSSDHVTSRRGKKILSTISKNDAPIRISETGYFNKKHDEVAESVYKRKAIGSKANCLACHQGAELGNFNEHEVRIPKASELPVKKK